MPERNSHNKLQQYRQLRFIRDVIRNYEACCEVTMLTYGLRSVKIMQGSNVNFVGGRSSFIVLILLDYVLSSLFFKLSSNKLFYKVNFMQL